MRVKAIKKGFIGGSLRYNGDEFEVPNGTLLGSWMIAVEPEPKPEPEPECLPFEAEYKPKKRGRN